MNAITYVALLRGIAPTNPNMHQSKLCGVLEDLGFGNVRAVISSGNVIFESDETDTSLLEKRIEAAWPEQLGFTSTTIIRSQAQLQRLIKQNPYKDVTEDPKLYRLVTFFKHPQDFTFDTPYKPAGKPYTLLATYDQTLFSVIDLNASKTPDFMTWIEKQFGKEITSRTWATVNRIIKKME